MSTVGPRFAVLWRPSGTRFDWASGEAEIEAFTEDDLRLIAGVDTYEGHVEGPEEPVEREPFDTEALRSQMREDLAAVRAAVARTTIAPRLDCGPSAVWVACDHSGGEDPRGAAD